MAAGKRIRAAALALLATACNRLGLSTASADFAGESPASPAVLQAFAGDKPITTREDWLARKPKLRAAFEASIYGPVPTELKGHEVGRRMIEPAYAEGSGTLEEIDVRVGEGADAPLYRIALALPRGASQQHPAPVVIAENFCGNRGNLDSARLAPAAAVFHCENDGIEGRIFRLAFGKDFIAAPTKQILARGYGYAAFYPAEIVDDDVKASKTGLAKLAAQLPPDRQPQGAIAVWAAAFGWSLDVLEHDPRIDMRRTAVFGHSRHGKAALLAGALDERIEAVISAQSGKGGATLTRSSAGESVQQITGSYPYWFPPFAAFAGREADIPVDQHQLIAMIAPRPVLLGNGWKDVWSDPNGAFRAALGADPVYKLMGAQGLLQTGLDDDAKHGELDFFIRPGGHAIRAADWDRYLDFLDRWFGKPASHNDTGIRG